MRDLDLSGTGRAMPAYFHLRKEISEALTSVTRGGTVNLSGFADRLAAIGEEGTSPWALAGALRALDRALRWEPALEAAEPQPERFRDSARHLAQKTLSVGPVDVWSPGLRGGLEILANLSTLREPARAAEALNVAALAAPVTTLFARRQGWALHRDEAAPEPEPVVHLRFEVDERAVAWPLAVRAPSAHPFGATVVVDAWPEGSDRLEITFQGVPSSVLEVDPIFIVRGADRGKSWMVAKVAIGIDDRVELPPVARFVGESVDQVAQVVGHRQLRVTTLDPALLGTGQPFVSQTIVDLVNELDTRIPGLPRQDRTDLATLLDATAAFSALALERIDLVGLDERGFQRKLKEAFVQDPRIGRNIQEGSRLGGGVVDLILRRVNDELKVIHEPVDIAHAERLVGQPTQYASGVDCPVSVLTVLDDSPKGAPPAILSNYMRWVYPQVHGVATPAVPSMVAVVIIRVGFRLPSDWTNTRTESAATPAGSGATIPSPFVR